MGIPINPDDPDDGGCPVCVPFVSDDLDILYNFIGLGVYRGTLVRNIVVPSLWQATFATPPFPPKTFGLQLCRSFGFDALLTVTGRLPFTIVDLHCNFPVSGFASGGDSFLFRELPL